MQLPGVLLRRPCWVVATVTCLAVPGPAFGQRADENAVTAAQDAFGTSIGFQNVGLYSANDARGFSPQQAGNLRIEGLYFDQQTWVTGDCMVRETTMRVGIAAQSYSFPAPTGIADLSLRTPGDKALVSAILTRGPFNSATTCAPATARTSRSTSSASRTRGCSERHFAGARRRTLRLSRSGRTSWAGRARS